MIYVVLGVGFSGTTLTSELIHHAGIKMIDEESDKYDKGGKYEHPEFQKINMDILNLIDDQVFQLRVLDCPKILEESYKDRMLRLIDTQNNRFKNWGFKDPRTVVTFRLWREQLPEHRVIAIYRDPASNWPRTRWRGLRKRYTNAWRAFIHLRQWYEYNDSILSIGSEYGNDFILLNYEKLMQTDFEINRLSSFLGKEIEDRRKFGMYRNKSQGDVLFRLIKWAMNYGKYSPDKMLNKLEQLHSQQSNII